MRYISPYLLLKYCELDDSELTSTALNKMRRELQMKFDFERLGQITVNGRQYLRKDVMNILNTCLYERDVRFHRWIHQMPVLREFLTKNKVTSTYFEIPEEIRNTHDFHGFKKFITPFLLPRMIACYNNLRNSGNYKRAAFINQLGVILDRLDYDDFILQIRQYLHGLQHSMAMQGGDIAELNELQDDFEYFLATLPRELRTERELLRSYIKAAVDHDLEIDNVGQRQQNRESREKESSDKRKERNRKNMREIQSVPNRSKKPSAYVWIIVAVVIVGIAMAGIVASIGIKNTMDDKESVSVSEWISGEDYSDFGGQMSKILEYVDEEALNISSSSVAKIKGDYYKNERPRQQPFSTFFYPLEEKVGTDGFQLINETNYAIVILVESSPESYSYFIESQSESQVVFSLYKGEKIHFYAGKEFVETDDLVNDDPKGFRYVDATTKGLLQDVYHVEHELENREIKENFDEGGNQLYHYKIHLWQRKDNIRATILYKRSIQLKPRKRSS